MTIPPLPDVLYHPVHIATEGDKESLAEAIYKESAKFFGGNGINLRRDSSAMEDGTKLDTSRVYVFWHMVAYITCKTTRLTQNTPDMDEKGNLTGEKEKVLLQ